MNEYPPRSPFSSTRGNYGSTTNGLLEKAKFGFSSLDWKLWLLIGGSLFVVFISLVLASVALGIAVNTSSTSSTLETIRTESPGVNLCPSVTAPIGDSELFLTVDNCADYKTPLYRNVIQVDAFSASTSLPSNALSTIIRANCPANMEAISGSCLIFGPIFSGPWPALMNSVTVTVSAQQHYCVWGNSSPGTINFVTFSASVICRVIV